MKISVVTAVYNRCNTIADAIESIHAQTYKNVEHVVQDGGSTDGTLEKIDGSSHGNTSLKSEPDDGIYDALNKGIVRATGDVVGFMHSDDFFASDTVLEKVAHAFADPSIDGVYGDLDYISASDPTQIIRRWRSGHYDSSKLSRGWMPPHPTLYLRKEVYEQWGLFDTRYRIAADYDAMLRYLTGGVRLAYVPEVFVKMRVGGESNKSVRKILRKSLEDYRAIRANQVGGGGTLLRKNFSKISQFF